MSLPLSSLSLSVTSSSLPDWLQLSSQRRSSVSDRMTS
jgi:hypothetical protein